MFNQQTIRLLFVHRRDVECLNVERLGTLARQHHQQSLTIHFIRPLIAPNMRPLNCGWLYLQAAVRDESVFIVLTPSHAVWFNASLELPAFIFAFGPLKAWAM